MNMSKLKDRECSTCGKKFDVEVDTNGKILTKGVFYGGKIRFGVGMWAAYEFKGYDEKEGKIIHKRIIPWYKYVWYTLRDLKRLLFHQYKEVEYWECPECNNEVNKNDS